jgi:hypothetical protein
MDDNATNNDDAAREPADGGSDSAALETAPADVDGGADGQGAPALAEDPPGIEEIVRREVERRIAEMFPARRETPRNAEQPVEVTPEDRLRLGYGSRIPQT